MSMLRFLPGVLIVQLATAALMVAATGAASERVWLPLAALGVVIAGIAAMWFGAIADHVRKDAEAEAAAKHAREREHLATGFAREREQIRVKAETEKLTALEETHQRIVRETGRAHNRANLKLGVGLLGLLSLGGLMLAIEFMTLGLLIFTTSGGALGGYLMRARQDRLALRKDPAGGVLEPPSAIKAIRAERVDTPAGRRKV